MTVTTYVIKAQVFNCAKSNLLICLPLSAYLNSADIKFICTVVSIAVE